MNGADLKKEKEERYAKYADRMIREHMEGALDWSIFESESAVMDGKSKTRKQISLPGTDHGNLP